MENANTKNEKNVIKAAGGSKTEVPCDFCGKKIKAPPEAANYAKHACYDCYLKFGKEIPSQDLGKVHVELPLDRPEVFERMMDNVVLGTFQDMWNTEKQNLKDMSKKELAQVMFSEGARFMYAFMQRVAQEQKKPGN